MRAWRRLPQGVSSAFLRLLLQWCEEDEGKEHDLTTAEACERVVKPRTLQPSPHALIDSAAVRGKADAQGRPFVGDATVFVSHAWGYKVSELVTTLLEHAEQAEKKEAAKEGAAGVDAVVVYFWLDLACNDQHASPNFSQQWWSDTFQHNIRVIGTTLLVLSPWQSPLPLARAWCLYELLCTVQQGCELVVGVPGKEREAFSRAVQRDFDSVLAVVAGVQVERAQASRESDRAMILQRVEETVGAATLNSVVNRHMRAWVARTATALFESSGLGSGLAGGEGEAGEEGEGQGGEAAEGAGDPQQVASLAYSLAWVMLHLGWIADARAWFERSKAAWLRLGEQFGVAACESGLGSVEFADSDYHASARHHTRAMEAFEQKFGASHGATAKAKKSLADAVAALGDFARAATLYEEALQVLTMLSSNGDEDDTIGSCHNSIGNLFVRLGEYERAVEEYRVALAIRARTSGERHSVYATLQSNLARTLVTLGDVGEGVRLLREALATLEQTIGRERREVAGVHHALARAHLQLGSYADALRESELEVEVLTGLLPSGARRNEDYALALIAQSEINARLGHHVTALALAEEALKILQDRVGEQHPAAVGAMHCMGLAWAPSFVQAGQPSAPNSAGLHEKGLADTLSVSAEWLNRALASAAAVGIERAKVVGVIRRDLALVRLAQGMTGEAVSEANQAVEHERAVAGEKGEVGLALGVLGVALSAHGDPGASRALTHGLDLARRNSPAHPLLACLEARRANE